MTQVEEGGRSSINERLSVKDIRLDWLSCVGQSLQLFNGNTK